jgi:hypothetical protein
MVGLTVATLVVLLDGKMAAKRVGKKGEQSADKWAA